MSASEIKSFEDFWKMFTAMFYEVIAFIRKAFDLDDKIGNINPVYPTK